MTTFKHLARRGGPIAMVMAFGVAIVLPALTSSGRVYAEGQFTPRKVTLSSQAKGTVSTDANGVAYTAGDGGNGSRATHTFNFTQATSNATIGSVALQYCTTPFFGDACTAPTGMNAATLTAGGTVATNFGGTQPTLDTTTTANTGFFNGTNACSGSGTFRANCVLLSRTAAATTGTPAFQIVAGNGSTNTSYITNPSNLGTYYVRITTFSNNTYGAANIVDQGAVAFSINDTIDITAKVQEKLNFSVGNVTSLTAPTASCAALTANNVAVALGDVNGILSAGTQYNNNSYWRVSTNASNGTVVQYSGDTLKTASGTNTIPATGATAVAYASGTEQFGLTTDSADTQAGNGHSLSTLNTLGQYGSAAAYAFSAASKGVPVTMASQGTPGVISCETASVKYLASVAATTKAGIYRTSVSFIATPTF